MEKKIQTNPVKVIRENCLDCIGSYAEIEKCTAEKTCKLWPFRMGKNPYRKKVTMSDERKAAATERFRLARERKAE